MELFSGTYYKHQSGNRTICFIVGIADGGDFIQIITENSAYTVPYIGNNKFSPTGIEVDIETADLRLFGEIKYSNLTPLKYDIMGPFKYFKMECRHSVSSMSHNLCGTLNFNGEMLDFSGGIGYIEGDSGNSFPQKYAWVQCLDFDEPCSIMASIATIPFGFCSFRGCICVVKLGQKEYRLATYLGVKIIECSENKIILKQGKYRLEIEINSQGGNALSAPTIGEMARTIIENPSCPARFKFYEHGKLIFAKSSQRASFEWEG